MCPLLCLALSLLIHIYYDEIWMTELLQTFSVALIPHVISACKKREKIGQKFVPLIHVCTHISLHRWNFYVEKGCWAVKKLCLAGRRFYRGQAGRHSENYINVKQIKMWYFKQDLSTIFCCRMKTTNIYVLQFNTLVDG